MLPLDGWAVAEVKLGACTGAAWLPRAAIGGSRLQSIRISKCRLRGTSWNKRSLQVVFGLLTNSAGKLVETGPEAMLPLGDVFRTKELHGKWEDVFTGDRRLEMTAWGGGVVTISIS